MKLKFYNQLAQQPDLQDIIQYIGNSLQTLENLQIKLDNLPENDLKSAAFAEISAKVDRLINKYFPNLTEDYCKLSLDYRNTAIIKKEHYEGKEHFYTSKDILLKNFSKLIEEISVLDHDFNNNYSHKLLVAHRIVDQMGVQKSLITTENEIENVKPVNLKNNFDYEHFKKSQPTKVIAPVTPKVVLEKKEIKNNNNPKSEVTKQPSVLSVSLIEVMLIVGFLSLALVMCLTIANKVSKNNHANNTVFEMEYLSSTIKDNYLKVGDSSNDKTYKDISINKIVEKQLVPPKKVIDKKYTNAFDGEILVEPETIKSSNDSFSITTTNIPIDICPKMVMQVKDSIKDSGNILVNNTSVIKNGDIDVSSVVQSCTLDSNTIKLITN